MDESRAVIVHLDPLIHMKTLITGIRGLIMQLVLIAVIAYEVIGHG